MHSAKVIFTICCSLFKCIQLIYSACVCKRSIKQFPCYFCELDYFNIMFLVCLKKEMQLYSLSWLITEWNCSSYMVYIWSIFLWLSDGQRRDFCVVRVHFCVFVLSSSRHPLAHHLLKVQLKYCNTDNAGGWMMVRWIDTRNHTEV